MAKDNPETSWDITALQEVLESQPQTRNYSIYQSDPRNNVAGEEAGPTYEFTTRYETGANGMVVTFSPLVTDRPLRTMESRSKFGYPRIQMLVIDPAPLSPFGVSRARLASPSQNLLNIYYGNIAAMLLLNSKPPILKKGRFTSPVQLKQGAVWETLDQDASANLVNMDNGALERFVQMAQYLAGQIETIMGVGPAYTALDNNSPNKPGGKNPQAPVENSSANQITKILENFLRQYALVALDTLISEQEGEESLLVDDATMNAINNLVPGTIGDDHKLLMDWERFYAGIQDWSIDIEVSVSKDQMKEQQRGDLQDMLTVLAQNATALGPEVQQRVQQITDMLLQDFAPDVKPIDIASGQPAQAAPQAAAGQSAVGSQVHETGDLVKMFGMTTDPTLRNAILSAMNLPQVARALPAELVNPVMPSAKVSLNAGGGYGGVAPAAAPTAPAAIPALTR